jgi:signal peptidase I
MNSTQPGSLASISNHHTPSDFSQPPSAGPVPPRSSRGAFLLWMRDVAISAVASILFILFLYQPVRVEGTSMMPRLENHDRLFINKFVYHFEAIDRGDVVVFHYPLDPSKSYIKRVIGLPGDRIQIIRGHVWLNGKLLREPYVPARYRDNDSMAAMIVPKDCYFVMGDHRSISSDSRAFGPVERSLIYGKAEFIYWPAKDAGVVH